MWPPENWSRRCRDQFGTNPRKVLSCVSGGWLRHSSHYTAYYSYSCVYFCAQWVEYNHRNVDSRLETRRSRACMFIYVIGCRDTISRECRTTSTTPMRLFGCAGMPCVSIQCEVIFHDMNSCMYLCMDNVALLATLLLRNSVCPLHIISFTICICIGAVH